jgi:hypothetical protein
MTLTLAALVFVSGHRVGRWLLILTGCFALGIAVWMTAVCFGDKGFGVVALIATFRALVIFVPTGAAIIVGILAGRAARRLVGIPANESMFDWLQRARRLG